MDAKCDATEVAPDPLSVTEESLLFSGVSALAQRLQKKSLARPRRIERREIPRSGSSLGTAILIGLPILRSVGRKCQTAEVCFSEGERADQPPVICRPQPGELKEQLRDSLGKGSAARHGAQCECGIC